MIKRIFIKSFREIRDILRVRKDEFLKHHAHCLRSVGRCHRPRNYITISGLIVKNGCRILSDMHVRKRSVPAAVEHSMLHEVPVFLIECDFRLHLINQFLRKIIEIAFIPERPETGHRKSRLHRSTP